LPNQKLALYTAYRSARGPKFCIFTFSSLIRQVPDQDVSKGSGRLPIDPRFGRAVKRIRESKGLTQEQVTERLRGVYNDVSSYARIEDGKRFPPRANALAILTRGLALSDPLEIDRLLALAGYEGQAGSSPVTADGGSESAPPATNVGASQAGSAGADAQTGYRSKAQKRSFVWWVIGPSILGTVGLSLLTADAWFVSLSALSYAALYVVSILLETTYLEQKPWLPQLSGYVFALMSISSALALVVDSALAGTFGLFLGLAICTAFAAGQWLISRPFLPSYPVVGTHTVQGAHLKNTEYFLLIVFVFWLPPFNCIAVLERASRTGQLGAFLPILHEVLLTGRGVICLNAGPLLGLFLFLIAFSIAMRSHILDRLKPGPHLNHYTVTFYVRAALYFGTCLLCIAWFAHKISQFSN